MWPKLIFRDLKANHLIKSGRNWMFKTFKANHFNILKHKPKFWKVFKEITLKRERDQKVNVENWEIRLRYQIRAFRQFQMCRRAGGVESESGWIPRVSWQDSRREEPALARPIGSKLGRESAYEKRGGPIANLAPNCISEMYQLKTCFDNSRKWSGPGLSDIWNIWPFRPKAIWKWWWWML